MRNESLASTQTYSSLNTSGSTNGNYTALSNQASIVASGAFQISAGRDITDLAGHISAANAGLTAARDVNFNALATGSSYVGQAGQDAQNNLTVGHALTQVNTTGDLAVSAGRPDVERRATSRLRQRGSAGSHPAIRFFESTNSAAGSQGQLAANKRPRI
jgi:hypothetical protein